MAADGTWNLTLETPMGERKATLTLATDGATLTGTQAAEGEEGAIFDGTADGDNVTWKVSITNPLPMTLEFEGAVAGDTLSGNMKAGMYGSWPFSGQRA